MPRAAENHGGNCSNWRRARWLVRMPEDLRRLLGVEGAAVAGSGRVECVIHGVSFPGLYAIK